MIALITASADSLAELDRTLAPKLAEHEEEGYTPLSISHAESAWQRRGGGMGWHYSALVLMVKKETLTGTILTDFTPASTPED